ncbi:hypothetical protein SBOR_7142 [Sclerotinia borealis F-4128]|uniref:FAD dependent oxidoreductase domain-containing protein n=1 Tax=Sclerotinia borealis (strain F-4128) TaxID=1432307 RepID=W9CCC0_SCLBF|nr:hypothetical protein SBOR_7142 [Sclerotinia borealis F-4128]
MTSQTSQTSYLIVGSGIFGTSTAYHLSLAHPHSSISLLDRSSPFPSSLAASHDYNKIIRADYEDIFYCELALKARELWRNDPLYKPYYHQSGYVIVDDTGLGRRIIGNYEKLGVSDHQARIVGPDELKTMYGGLFEGTDWKGVKEVFMNEGSGWAEATKAVQKIAEMAKANGVKFIEGDVENIVLTVDGDCIGVLTKDGRTFRADKIILSTGAGTAKLLADSAPQMHYILAEDRITAAAVVVGHVKLSETEYEKIKHTPVFHHMVGEVLGAVLPPTSNGILKFCADISLKNTALHECSGHMISAPPNEADQAQHNVPKILREECYRVMKGIYGKMVEEFEFDSFRMCWDGITPNQDFIISAHPRCQSLYIATGGSFHAWKFLPIIGDYVVKMLDNELDADFAKRWAWDRDQKGSVHEQFIPKRELRDLS